MLEYLSVGYNTSAILQQDILYIYWSVGTRFINLEYSDV